MIEIYVNGQVQRITESIVTVAALLEQLGLQGQGIAVARNGEVIPRSVYEQVRVQSEDKIDIVHAIGGG